MLLSHNPFIHLSLHPGHSGKIYSWPCFISFRLGYHPRTPLKYVLWHGIKDVGPVSVLFYLHVTHSEFASSLLHITCCSVALYFCAYHSICLEIPSRFILELLFIPKYLDRRHFLFTHPHSWTKPLIPSSVLILWFWFFTYHEYLFHCFSSHLDTKFLEVRDLVAFIFVCMVLSVAPDTMWTQIRSYWIKPREVFLTTVNSIKAFCIVFFSWLIQFTLTYNKTLIIT